MMRETNWPVAHASANTDDLHVGAVVANVVADLFQAAQGGETADRVGKNRVALERKAGSQARHVLLRDAHIEELPGESVM